MEIRRGIVKHGKRGVVSRFSTQRMTKTRLVPGVDLNSVLLVFGVSVAVCARPPPSAERLPLD